MMNAFNSAAFYLSKCTNLHIAPFFLMLPNPTLHKTLQSKCDPHQVTGLLLIGSTFLFFGSHDQFLLTASLGYTPQQHLSDTLHTVGFVD
jgi:hypothetical protein